MESVRVLNMNMGTLSRPPNGLLLFLLILFYYLQFLQLYCSYENKLNNSKIRKNRHLTPEMYTDH